MADQNPILSFLKEQATNGTIGLAETRKAADIFNSPLHHIEELALEHSLLPARFQRNGLDCSEQLKLLRARVAIIGCGGLGGRTAELLARLGIGTLLLTDPDTFSESNLNRQLFCRVDTINLKKVDVISRELGKINPAIRIDRQDSPFSEQSIDGADVVIDGLDSTGGRKALAGLCHRHATPLVHGAVKQWYGQVGIDQGGNELINRLYPQEGASPAGPRVMVMSVAFVAAMQAAETCKLLLDHNSILSRGWLLADLLHCDFETVMEGQAPVPESDLT